MPDSHCSRRLSVSWSAPDAAVRVATRQWRVLVLQRLGVLANVLTTCTACVCGSAATGWLHAGRQRIVRRLGLWLKACCGLGRCGATHSCVRALFQETGATVKALPHSLPPGCRGGLLVPAGTGAGAAQGCCGVSWWWVSWKCVWKASTHSWHACGFSPVWLLQAQALPAECGLGAGV